MEYKYFALVATATLLLGLCFVIRKWPYGLHATFSQHVARHKAATIFYFLLFAITLPLLCAFFVEWLTPQFLLTPWINVLVIASSLFQIACTVIPEVAGWRAKWHQALAGVSAVLLLPVLGIIALSEQVETAGKIAVSLGMLCMVGVILLAVCSRGKHSQLLLLQSCYFTAFFVPLLFVTHVTQPVLRLTGWEDENLIIYSCDRPVEAKHGFWYNLMGKHPGLEPANMEEFNRYCHAMGIE